MGVLEPRVQAARDAAAKSVADGNTAFEQLKADYAASADQRLARDRLALERLQSDPYHLGRKLDGNLAALNEHQVIEARIRQAETEALAAAARETARIEHAMAGVIDHNESRTTFGSEIPQRDFVAGVQGVLDRGGRSEVLEHYLKTGAGGGSGDRAAEVKLAEQWQARLMSDPELQKKFLAGDAEVMKQFQHYGVYARKFDEE